MAIITSYPHHRLVWKLSFLLTSIITWFEGYHFYLPPSCSLCPPWWSDAQTANFDHFLFSCENFAVFLLLLFTHFSTVSFTVSIEKFLEIIKSQFQSSLHDSNSLFMIPIFSLSIYDFNPLFSSLFKFSLFSSWFQSSLHDSNSLSLYDSNPLFSSWFQSSLCD